MKKRLENLSIGLNALTIFRGLLENPVVAKLQRLLWLAENGESINEAVSAYSDFVSALYKESPNLTKYLLHCILNDENFYIKSIAMESQLSASISSCLKAELDLFQRIGALTPDDIKSAIGYHQFLPEWDRENIDFEEEYNRRLSNLKFTGYGIYSKHNFFYVKDGAIEAVKYPDAQKIDHLFGYERERDLVIKNTQALLDEGRASNVLLYGDAGTGKSSTIKAITNQYAPRGLRLVEVPKNQLIHMPAIMNQLSDNPLKFILFIDDLSFAKLDDNFSALKAILEGSSSVSGDNVVIYATSNRRHLIRESHSDRSGDDVHANDTLQDTMGLAARFGLGITFGAPSKDEYLYIVDRLADEYHLTIDRPSLHRMAEAYALKNNGRSPRVAKHFVELQKIGI